MCWINSTWTGCPFFAMCMIGFGLSYLYISYRNSDSVLTSETGLNVLFLLLSLSNLISWLYQHKKENNWVSMFPCFIYFLDYEQST